MTAQKGAETAGRFLPLFSYTIQAVSEVAVVFSVLATTNLKLIEKYSQKLKQSVLG